MAMLFLALILIMFTTTLASEETCNSNDGACINPSESVIRSDALIHKNSDGSITLGSQTYSQQADGYKIIRHVSKIQQHYAPLLDKLEPQQQHPDAIPSESGKDELHQTVVDISTTLVEELSTLSLLHREEWVESSASTMLDSYPLDEEEDLQSDDSDSQYANDQFNKAVNAYEAVILVYKHLWPIVQIVETGAEIDAPLFSPYDQEAISAGHSSSYLLLADMYHQRYLLGDLTTTTIATAEGDCSEAYRYLILAENWCNESLSKLGVDLEGNDLAVDEEQDEEGGGTIEDKDEDHDTFVYTALQSMAFVHVRIGALLVDMYATGYVLDDDGNLRLEEPPELMAGLSEEYSASQEHLLGQGQKRILDLSLQKLSKGLTMYSQLLAAEEDGSYTKIDGDTRLNVADASNYIGVVYSHLYEFEFATSYFETSMSLYNLLFDEAYQSGMVDDALQLASGMIQTTQSAWETCLNLPGKTECAKVTFHRHLVLRRYYQRQVSPEHPLTDDDTDDDDYHSDAQLNSIYQSYGIDIDSQFEESINAYRKMLDDYLKLIRESPEGSYYTMEFGAGGDDMPSYIQADKVYEGSIRSAIGSLLLAKNDVHQGKSELELAVGLLREGLMEGRDSFEAMGEDGVYIEMPVSLEIANALLNLAYALLGMNQWKQSYDMFEEAMDIYDSSLADGETPMNHSEGAGSSRKSAGASWGEQLTRFFKESIGLTDTTNEAGDKNEDKSSSGAEYINLDSFQTMDNNITNQIM